MKPKSFERVAVVGANSQIGQFLIPRLEANNYIVVRIGRQAFTSEQQTVHAFDELREEFQPTLTSVNAIISLAPLPHIDSVLKMAACLGAQRIIAFGSTGRYTKSSSPSAIEQDFVTQQIKAETLLEEGSKNNELAWTLFRPTMIYGAEMDQNISFIASFIRRFGFFPIALGANGLRQPVHADDLAGACVSALECERTFNRSYNLGGGERVSYTDMVRHIFDAEAINPRIVKIPAPIFSAMINIAKNIIGYNFIRKEMVTRMFDDLIADNSQAESDFGYTPRAFRTPHPTQ